MDILVKVPDSKVEFFMELVHNLKFKAEPKPKTFTPAQWDWIDGLKEALAQVELHQQGKIKLKSFDQVLNELQD